MGLDAVEILMEVEESFGITIPEDRASMVRTVGDLYAIVLEETSDITRDNTSCVTAATFYSLRRHLIPYVPNPSAIRPTTSVAESLRRRDRPRLWAKLQYEMDLRFPPLQRPGWLRLLAVLITATIGWLVLASSLISDRPGLTGIMTLLSVVLAGLILAVVTKPFAICTAPSYSDYRGLVTQIVSLNYAKLSESSNTWNASDVWNVLQWIIVEQLGVKKQAVTLNANFVYDLGMD
ncbi:acyl carrier protein [Planctomycetes bacterium CA13]|uniref:Acyl carrier protein n=1 Tax=Novipirellula herctigrandis TaxID=2527986 RepID=A0A5C5YUS7_9BACT|nr:acyl carrier protein [Planctomycetes bacterium CA13]